MNRSVDIESNSSEDSVFYEIEIDKFDYVHLVQQSQAGTTSQKEEKCRMATERRRSSIFELMSKTKPSGSTMLSFVHVPSKTDEATQRIQVKYENTFKMEPSTKFQPTVANDIIHEVLKAHLEGKRYEPALHSQLCRTMAQEIKRLASPGLERYKLVAFVTVGQKNDHDVRMASRCLWDTDKDSSASAHYENSTLFAAGVLYALYFE